MQKNFQKPRPQPKRPPKDALPPHSLEAEMGALGCILMLGDSGEKSGQLEIDNMLGRIGKPTMFYDFRCRAIYLAMAEMRLSDHAVSETLLCQWLKDKKKLKEAGDYAFVASLQDKTPGVANFDYYLTILREKHHRRFLKATADRLAGYADAAEIDLAETQSWLADLTDSTRQATQKRKKLVIWTAKDIEKMHIDPRLTLVGDNEIAMGYDGVAVIAGPGSSGKSLAVLSLALAGAIGHGLWMGRKVHRQFKTLILQAENGPVRLKKEFDTLAANHPDVKLAEHVFISEPPEGGLPFHNAEFRAAVRQEIDRIKPDLVVLDPWSQVATEDAAKEVVDKLAEIRSCFPPGDECPGLLIVAHTSKPRPENVRRGRGLAYMVSGSVALPNTARTVYVLLPWAEDITDDRIYWACPKLNNGENYAPSVWHRRFGTFFEHDAQTDPTTWGQEPDSEERNAKRHAITRADLEKAFGDRPGMKKRELIKALKGIGHDEATVYRALKPDGYLTKQLTEVAGVVAIKKETEEE